MITPNVGIFKKQDVTNNIFRVTYSAIYAVRQMYDNARLTHPFALGVGDESVINGLAGIGEITILSFPNCQ